MGTRSITIIKDEIGAEITRIYRQCAGEPGWHGKELAKLCSVSIVNGFSGGKEINRQANGMDCLAAQVIRGLKQDTIDSGTRGKRGIGHIYVTRPDAPHFSGAEFVYTVSPGEHAGEPVISVAKVARGGAGTYGSPDTLTAPIKTALASAFRKWAARQT